MGLQARKSGKQLSGTKKTGRKENNQISNHQLEALALLTSNTLIPTDCCLWALSALAHTPCPPYLHPHPCHSLLVPHLWLGPVGTRTRPYPKMRRKKMSFRNRTCLLPLLTLSLRDFLITCSPSVHFLFPPRQKTPSLLQLSESFKCQFRSSLRSEA